MIALLNVPLEDEYLWKCTDLSTVIEYTLRDFAFYSLAVLLSPPQSPKVAYSTLFFSIHHCYSAIFSFFTNTFPPNYFAAVNDVVTNCLNTNCVSKQISAVRESFGKYREWQHWLSIWAQLFSSLVGTHKHMNTMTDAHTHIHSCQWFGCSGKTFEFCSAYMYEMKLQRANMAWHETLVWK